MPRRILARRFEPRYGVSQAMFDAESRYVAREREDYLVFATNELRARLGQRQAGIERAEEQLLHAFGALPERERLALRCMLARDIHHIAMLYLTTLGNSTALEVLEAPSPPAEEPEDAEEPMPILPFRETLFD